MQVFLWNADTLKQKSILEEHSLLIADVRFSPSTPRLGTSSFDKTVRVWDADNVSVIMNPSFPALFSHVSCPYVRWHVFHHAALHNCELTHTNTCHCIYFLSSSRFFPLQFMLHISDDFLLMITFSIMLYAVMWYINTSASNIQWYFELLIFILKSREALHCRLPLKICVFDYGVSVKSQRKQLATPVHDCILWKP